MSESAETRTRDTRLESGPDLDRLLIDRQQNEVNNLGRSLVSHFYKVAKTAGMFDFSNVITQDAVRVFLDTLLESLATESQIVLTMASDCLFVNESRLKIDFEGFTSFKYVIEALKSREIGSIIFRRETDEPALETFLRLFLENDGRDEEPLKKIQVGLRKAGTSAISVEEIRDLPEGVASTNVRDDFREASINTYFKSIFIAKQFIENFRGPRGANFRKAKRLVHSVVDLVAEEDSTLLALTQIKNFDNFLFTHSANVCVLSVAVGQQIGLGKGLLAHLGLAALLHDVGLTAMPRELFSNRKQLSPDDIRIYERHPAIGARSTLKSQGVSESSIRCLLVAWEHHMLEDGTGFPPCRDPSTRTLFGRIVGTVDFYDSVTTPGESSEVLLTPEEALQLMANEGRAAFDSAIVKLLANTIGTYPLGTVVRLDTGEVGIVHRKSTALDQPERPVVKLIADEYGMPVPPRVLDLNEFDPQQNRHRRTIVETVSPSDYFDDLREFTGLV